jgi:ATP phosphoribosyltransferase regulatory subunit
VPGWGLEIARGGRYDDIGRVFGRARPAVGFSTDLKELLRHGRRSDAGDGGDLCALVRRAGIAGGRRSAPCLRTTCVHALPGLEQDPRDPAAGSVLVERDGRWELDDILAE